MFTELGRAIRGEVVLHLFHAELAPRGGAEQLVSRTQNGARDVHYEHETSDGSRGDRRRLGGGGRLGGGTQTVSGPSADELDKLGRNDPCWCGSGKKFKKCHGA